MAAQHLPRDLVRTSSGPKELAQKTKNNLLTTNTGRPIISSKDADFRLVFWIKVTKNDLLGLGPRARWSGPKKPKPLPDMTSPTKKLKSKISYFFLNLNYKTFCIFRHFEQLSGSMCCWVMAEQRLAQYGQIILFRFLPKRFFSHSVWTKT